MTPDSTTSTLRELAPGSDFGAYRIVRLLGRGGMGAVYEAVHTTDGRVVALKLLSVDLDQMDSRERFLREGRTAAAINHPNAVYIYGTEEIAGTPVISMELVPGGTLEEKVKARGALPLDEAIDDIVQVIDGLDAALAAGILHRDVKPANCFVSASGVVKIGDFGLSKPVEGEEQQKLTRTGVFLGTPVFSSPEQLLGETLDARSDIYAVGVTFYYLLTGALPYQSGSMMQVIAAVLNGEPTPLASHRASLPPDVVEVVMKSIARKPGDRYQSYDEFRTAVLALRKPETTPATLWDRARASFVDFLAVTLVTWVLMFTTVTIGRKNWASASPQWIKLDFMFSLAFTVALISVPEALRGISLGKWLVGTRVVRRDGSVPGFARALGRTAVFELLDFLALVGQLTALTQKSLAQAIVIVVFVLRVLLLSTVRRSNGWMMLHDWLTGTRVIRPSLASQPRRGEPQRKEAPALSGRERRIGPYDVLGPVTASSAVLLGWDASMHRVVWIVPGAGTAEISPARRDLARLTRLRWVAGRRAGSDAWDAYEAPFGEPLAERLTRPVTWQAQQEWMLDLIAELIAAGADGTLPVLDAASLWVTPADRLVIPEAQAGLAANVASAANAANGGNSAPVAFVKRVMVMLDDAARTARESAPLPRHATEAIAAAKSAASLEELQAIFKGTIGKPTRISRARRAGLIAGTIGSVVVFPILAILPLRQQYNADPEGHKYAALLGFVGDSMHALPDSLRPQPDRPSLLGNFNAALTKAGWLPSDTALNRISPETYREQSRLAQVYIATVQGARAADSASTSLYGQAPPQRRLAREIRKRYANADSSEIHAARVLVDSTWRGAPPGATIDLLIRVVGAVLVLFVPWTVAAFAVVIALVFRRGLLMRGFQIDIVTADGRAAGRARILVRNIVSWSPVLAPFVIIAAVDAASPAAAPAALDLIVALTVAVIAAVAWIAIRTPARGIADRVAGTFLVPE